MDRDSQAIAVIGMGCKFPGAESLDEYWRLLDDGKSMATDPPPSRFPTHGHARSTERSVFTGNFLADVASFDHRFFRKSSREAASMDPQQRLLLEVAYQALESSGFFGPGPGGVAVKGDDARDVGCFVGVCASDYNDNVASHPPNAYSTLGSLRAFLTGRLSHFFGLSGPSITYDTACSSSAVAIDAACKAIIHGDCKSALAGGVSIFTSPHFFQNLAAASFLSPTGPTKSFDARADGYCRGEGIGLVVLKRLSDALADGDAISGIILATSVKQNSNEVPITVPYSPSQTALYRHLLSRAGVAAEDVTYLEAHGTGTPIGDLNEFESIRDTFGGSVAHRRRSPLYFASAKGNIGHTEGASGVASLIKTLLMLERRLIPRQANHIQLNPKINLIPDQIVIPLETVPWESDTRFAMVNNYGATGNIAAILVKESPKPRTDKSHHLNWRHTGYARYHPMKVPVCVFANDAKALARNCEKLNKYAVQLSQKQKPESLNEDNSLADLAFNLSDKQNRSLPKMLVTTASNIKDLQFKLQETARNPDSPELCNYSTPKPVVLMFGGQTSQSVGLEMVVFRSCALLRKYLDECNTTLTDLGYGSIYPQIFSAEPVADVVALHSMQFALQWACAQSWIACGLKVSCILGHSFGQLVGLTVSGVLSLADGLKLVCGRAILMRDAWGTEKGSMLALDADTAQTSRLISAVRKMNPSSGLEVACYNGTRAHVLVGSASEIQQAVGVARNGATEAGAKLKCKILNVTHGFHSRFCDAIVSQLETLAQGLTYNEPQIPIETCSTTSSWSTYTAKLVANHTRLPVYFGEAIERIEAIHGACTWLEAGSSSSITAMARRALIGSQPGHLFCPILLSGQSGVENPMNALVDTTIKLWQHGHHAQFWPFHRVQREDYQPLNLPPYQFEKNRHWLDFNLGTLEKFGKAMPAKPELIESGTKGGAVSASTPQPAPRPIPVVEPEPDPILISQCMFKNEPQTHAQFSIDPRSAEWKTMVAGHSVLHEALCPAPLYVELLVQAVAQIASLRAIDYTSFPRIHDLKILSALGSSHDKTITLDLKQTDRDGRLFDFVFTAMARDLRSSDGNSASGFSVVAGAPTTHVTGRLELMRPNERSNATELSRVDKLLQYQTVSEMMAQSNGEAAHGALVYKIFSRVVQYHDFYRGIRSVASNNSTTNGLESVVAHVSLPDPQPPAVGNLVCKPVVLDNFLQVAGLNANCLGPCPPDEVFVCTHIDQFQWSADFDRLGSQGWDVLVLSSTQEDSNKESINDIFARDHATGKLGFVAYGANFSRVRSASLSKVLARANMTLASSNAQVSQQPAGPGPAASITVEACPQPEPTRTKGVEPKAVSTPRVAHLQPAVLGVNETVKTSTKSMETEVATQAFETQLRSVLARITDIPEDQFRANANLADLGIDSLMGTEIASEVEAVFHVSIPPDALLGILTFASLRDYISAHSNVTMSRSEAPSRPIQVVPVQQSKHVEVPRRESIQTAPARWDRDDEAVGDLLEMGEEEGSFRSPNPTPGLDSSNPGPDPDAAGHILEHQHEELVSRLASLLADHLECPVTALRHATNLSNLGLDSLLCMELMSDIQKIFGLSVDLAKLTTDSTFGELSHIFIEVAGQASSSTVTSTGTPEKSPSISSTTSIENDLQPYQEKAVPSRSSPWSPLSSAPQQFESVKADLDGLIDEYGFAGFYRNVASLQNQLVLAYTVEAMADLGVQLDQINTGDTIPYPSDVLPKHHRLRDALFEILRHGGIADYDGRRFVRSDKPITGTPAAHSSALLRNITAQFPQHANEHRLLAVTGSELAALMRGTKDPLRLLYGSKENRTLLEDVYGSSPMYIIMSRLLATFLDRALSDSPPPGPGAVFRILELGAGTGSTTRWVLDRLQQRGVSFEYTFSDISTALTSAARRKFASHPASSRMRYATIDIETKPPLELCGQYDVVLSTNCIHATRNLGESLKNIASLLKPHGFVSLVEFTTRFYWFDLVFGLLDGWWLFDDGRPYVLASPEFWAQAMRGAGFGHVSWTGDSTRESEAVRVITGFKKPAEGPALRQSTVQERTGAVETLVYGYAEGKLPLRADVFHPSPSQAAAHKTWNVGMV